MTIELPYPPSANIYWQISHGRLVKTQRARDYFKEVLIIAQLLEWDDIAIHLATKPVKFTVHVYRPKKRGDLDNCLKVLIDSLNGIAYVDDDQITEIHAYRHEDKENPRVMVTIEEC